MLRKSRKLYNRGLVKFILNMQISTVCKLFNHHITHVMIKYINYEIQTILTID